MSFRLINKRREFLRMSAASGAVFILNSCGGHKTPTETESGKQASAEKVPAEKGGEVTSRD